MYTVRFRKVWKEPETQSVLVGEVEEAMTCGRSTLSLMSGRAGSDDSQVPQTAESGED